MNKKGFTLIELLATIMIISLLAAIATVSYSLIMNRVTTKAFESYRDSMHAEAIYYVTNYPERITWTNGTSRIMLNDLNMKQINNPKKANDLCLNSYVDLTRGYSSSGVLSISYNVCLKCNDFDECKTYEN